jgi:hypothetical protein
MHRSRLVRANKLYRFTTYDTSDRGGSKPRRILPSVMIWITLSQGAACDACGKTIPVRDSQYEVVMQNGREVRLDRDCFRRRIDELT